MRRLTSVLAQSYAASLPTRLIKVGGSRVVYPGQTVKQFDNFSHSITAQSRGHFYTGNGIPPCYSKCRRNGFSKCDCILPLYWSIVYNTPQQSVYVKELQCSHCSTPGVWMILVVGHCSTTRHRCVLWLRRRLVAVRRLAARATNTIVSVEISVSPVCPLILVTVTVTVTLWLSTRLFRWMKIVLSQQVLFVVLITWQLHIDPAWNISLTLWHPLLPYGYIYKACCARPG